MKPAETAAYTRVVVGQERGVCLLCSKVLQPGDLCYLVPSDCGETDKMHALKPYKGVLMHRRCVERVP